MFYIVGAVFVGALVGWASERLGLTRNGFVVSIALGVGGAILAWFAQGMLGINFGLGRTGVSFFGAAAMLFLAGLRR